MRNIKSTMNDLQASLKKTSIKAWRHIKSIFTTTSPLYIVAFLIFAAYTVFLLYLIVWGLLTSMKDSEEFLYNVLGLPNQFRLSNYVDVIDVMRVEVKTAGGTRYVYMEGMLLNSILVAVGGSILLVSAQCFTAYCVAKFSDYPISKILYTFNIITIILPVVGSGPSQLQVMHALGLYDNIFGFWVTKLHYIGLDFMIFHAYFKSISKEYAEAAEIDGASQFGIFFRIMFPLATGMFLTLFLTEFVGMWNDYQTPLLIIPNHPTLSIGVFEFSRGTGNATSDLPHKVAGCMILFLPIFIVFLAFHNRLMNNVTMGGVKE